jgi:hypothetical protein
MPILKRRHDFMKVYRPSGARYAECRDGDHTYAYLKALDNFRDEFGHYPAQEKTYIEIMGVTADWVATVWEIEDA